jgi:ankyrin repeat protein
MPQAIENPNRQGPFGNTLLHSAVTSGDIREVRRLLAAGADPRIANREGQTPIRVAAILGHDDIYRTLSAPRDAHIEWLLDQALEQTFPASDPIAVTPKRGQDPFSEKGS